MRVLFQIVVSGFLVGNLLGATSTSLFAQGGETQAGTPGNIIFAEQRFVVPSISSQGAISLSFINSNGITLSNWNLSLTGSSARVAWSGTNLLLIWTETNSLRAASVTNAALANISLVATNAADGSAAFSGTNNYFFVVWQNTNSPSAVSGKRINANGTPTSGTITFGISPQAQQFPSVATDGLHTLVCWMQQNVTSNDWRVVANALENADPFSGIQTVSQTNSLRPHPTACVFGTNFLVAWSADEDRGPILTPWGYTNLIYPMVYGRMVSRFAAPQGNAFIIARHGFTNRSPAIAFSGTRFLAAWARGEMDSAYCRQLVQPLAPNGATLEYPVISLSAAVEAGPAIAFGEGRFCVLYGVNGTTASVVFAPEEMPASLLDVRRDASGGIAVNSTNAGFSRVETTTNFVDWTPRVPSEIPTLVGYPELFVRVANYKWRCIDQLRAIEWAKRTWQIDFLRDATSTPSASDLFGPGRYLPQAPVCPNDGIYSLQSLSTKATCTIPDHTL